MALLIHGIMRPQKGDKIWVEGEHPQPNGTIIMVNWDAWEVVVQFLDADKSIKHLSFDALDGNWTDRFGGTWMIYSWLEAY